MKKSTWLWLGVAAIGGYLLYKYYGQSANLPQLTATVQGVTTDDADNLDISFNLVNPTATTLTIPNFSISVTYSNGSVGTVTENLSLAPGANGVSLAVPIPAAIQNDLEGAVNNGGSGYVVNLIGSSATYGFSTSYNLP